MQRGVEEVLRPPASGSRAGDAAGATSGSQTAGGSQAAGGSQVAAGGSEAAGGTPSTQATAPNEDAGEEEGELADGAAPVPLDEDYAGVADDRGED